MPALANLPVEIWERIIHDAVEPASPMSRPSLPWMNSFRSESLHNVARRQQLHNLQLLSGVARAWRELCITLSYETFLLLKGDPTTLRWLLNTQLSRFPSLFHRTRRLIVHFPCLWYESTHQHTITLFVNLVREMPLLQDLAVQCSPFWSHTEYRLVEKRILEALRLIGSRLLFLEIQEPMDRCLSGNCVLTPKGVGTLSALATNLTRLICAVEVDKFSLSDHAPSFPNLQVFHMQLHADRSQQAGVNKWIHRWQLGALKQFSVAYCVDPPIEEWVPMLLSGNNGRNLEVFDVGTTSALVSAIPPALWAQCPNLHTIIGPGRRRFRLSLPPTHRPLKALVYKGDSEMLLCGNLSQKHFLQELRDVDFAANTIIGLPDVSWRDILDYPEYQNVKRRGMNGVSAGIGAGLRFVDVNGEALDEFFARTGTGSDVL